MCIAVQRGLFEQNANKRPKNLRDNEGAEIQDGGWIFEDNNTNNSFCSGKTSERNVAIKTLCGLRELSCRLDFHALEIGANGFG